MLETMSQMPPSQTWLKVCKIKKEKKRAGGTPPKTRLCSSFFLSLTVEGVCGQVFNRPPHGRGLLGGGKISKYKLK